MDNTCSPCKNISKSMLRTGVLLFGDGFDRKFSMEIDFVLMLRKENESEYFAA